ncbi:DUF935 domain-containing protein [Candidatus Tokpelaia sp.]|uniref:DUF935 domain-containing protein n=1 Tax=Candidatus Tokpelaia sp. TaxID=2233777 RepID=UPI00123AE4F3|nr:DUF935 family protein [Candidatus Tokpelaia sp.]KAA6404480.1 hypothetical protein DPQ22_09620 [Candidatus Tokpelaia sp.]
MSKRKNRHKRVDLAAAKPAAAVQAAAISANLFRILATNQNDVYMPQYTKAMRSQDRTILMKGAGKGIRLYDEVLEDGHAYSVLNKRKDKIIARNWVVEAAEEDDARAQAAAELVEKALKRINFDVVCKGLLDAVLYGYAVAEIEWELVDNLILPRAIARQPQRRFLFDPEGRPRLLTRQDSGEGEALPDRKFIVHRHDFDGSDPYGRGLGRILYWHILFKREGVGFWGNFLEKYASPTPVGKYPLGTPPDEQDRLLDKLAAMVQQGALVLPLGSEVEFLESTRDAKVSYGDWCSYWDEQTSIAVLGENLSTSLTDDGSRAAAETHMEVSDGVADADSDLLSATLSSTLAQWIVDFNMPGAPVPSIYRPRSKNQLAEEQYRQARAGRIKADMDNMKGLLQCGFKPKQGLTASLSAILDDDVELLTEADKTVYADILAAGKSEPAAGGIGGFGSSAGSFGFSAPVPAEHDHGLQAILDQIEDASQPVIDGWLQMIKSRLKQAQAAGKTLEEMRVDLLTLYPELDTMPLGEILTDAQAVGELMGRDDVHEDTRRIADGI